MQQCEGAVIFVGVKAIFPFGSGIKWRGGIGGSPSASGKSIGCAHPMDFRRGL